MRTKDIRIGERYLARHCGRTIVVKVTASRPPATAGATSTIIVSNTATNERLELTPLSIMRPVGPTIVEVRQVGDLYEDQIAVPESGVTYRLRNIDGSQLDCGTVDYIIRRSDALVAKTSNGKELPITGEGAAILVPTRA
ncbi:MAG: hypothetical protein KDA61_03415 [Planctomycetales bacterium]|nr:hypothetical protein [Planctomycetales bacterium]